MKSITVEPKKRGRPSKGGREPLIGLRLSAEKIAAIDAWAAKNDVSSRSEAIRRLLDEALPAKKKAVSTSRTVTVWGKVIPIEVYEESKTVWIAVGSYNGRRIQVKGRTESSAIAQWQQAAQYQGN